MNETKQEKKRTHVTLFQVVAEKTGVTASHVTKVARGDRMNETISQEINKLNNVIEIYKSEPIQEAK